MTSNFERQMDFRDILVSCTNPRGLIRCGNQAFVEVSGFEWGALHKAPHKILRHPDMPKGVFWLFWQTLQAGEPIGAYVKNKTKNGASYWVFACAEPVDNGYISVRIKPQPTSVALISDLYWQLREKEEQEGLSPEQSGAVLLSWLKEQGYDDYRQFMAKSLEAEYQARQRSLARAPLNVEEDLASLLSLWPKITALQTDFAAAHDRIKNTPVNLGIQASRLQGDGNPLSVIATNFETLAKRIKETLAAFSEAANVLSQTFSESAFLIYQAWLTDEVMDVFANETLVLEGVDRISQTNLFRTKAKANTTQAVQSIEGLTFAIQTFSKASKQVHALLEALSIAGTMCEIEGARLDNVDAQRRIEVTVADLTRFRSTLRLQLDELERILASVPTYVAGLKRAFSVTSEAA